MNGRPILTPVVILVCVAAYSHPGVAALLVFDRGAIVQGEAWRLFTSHFVHFGVTHLVYNLLAFGVAGWIIERRRYPGFASLLALSAPTIGAILFFLEPGMVYFGGLSGLACGAVFYGALFGVREPGPLAAASKAILLLLPVKIVLELIGDAPILPHWGNQAFVVMPLSHVAGILTAFLLHAWLSRQPWRRRASAADRLQERKPAGSVQRP